MQTVIKNFRWDDVTEIFLQLSGDSWSVVYMDYQSESLKNLYENCSLEEAVKVATEWETSGENGKYFKRISKASTPSHYIVEADDE